MRGEVRAEELTSREARAARELLGVYARLADRGAHALGELLADGPPRAWDRLPADDAVDGAGLYQWFYHSHGPEDGRGLAEHGHFHLFARRALWERIAEAPEVGEFASVSGADPAAETRHLLAISMDAKGVPVGFFTTASRVTGDPTLSSATTMKALRRLELDTGFPEIDRLLASLIALCLPEVRELLASRDEALRAPVAQGSEPPEVLSEIAVDLESKIAAVSRATSRARQPARSGQTRRARAPARGETSAGARAR